MPLLLIRIFQDGLNGFGGAQRPDDKRLEEGELCGWVSLPHQIRARSFKILTRSLGPIFAKLPPPCRGFLPFHADGHWLACVWTASSNARPKCPLLVDII